ncbi:MAG: CPBP family intramembrane metalloprotease, partial [Chitinophagaceae bacterium]|nr:CPBP family intramembrane metalloprotease [Chitinophagaceae bacterium]
MKKRFDKEQVWFAIGGFTMGALLVSIGALIVYLGGAISWATEPDFETSDLVFGLLLMLLLAAAEEYIFRRLILRKLARSYNPWLALFVSSVLFAAVHLMNKNISILAITNVFMGGLVFGITYMYIRSIV